MSPDLQRIRIAEACGWKRPILWGMPVNDCESPSHEWFDRTQDYQVSLLKRCPDYLNSLDAMHEAEATLVGKQRQAYRVTLKRVCNHPFHTHYVHATAAQRGEAFLRTLNRWEEDQQEEKQ